MKNVSKGLSKRAQGVVRALIPFMAAATFVASPVAAQVSHGFKFLEAVRKKDGDAVEKMLSEPGTTIVNTRDISSGRTALHTVTERRDPVWMNYLISKGANVNARDSRGVTPLSIASNLGFSEAVELLVKGGARVDETNDAGETPLITAVHRRDVPMMRIFLKAGANPDRADNSGRSARDYARLDSRPAILAEIEAQTQGRPAASSRPVYGPSF